MSHRLKRPSIAIPHVLTEAIRKSQAILFLGAGASKECKNAAGLTPPNGEQLRDILAQRYFGKPMANRTLMTVAEMAIQSAGGRNLVLQTVADAFSGFNTSEAHRIVTDFNWRAIATTNYDIFLEEAYADATRRRQTLVPFVKDDEPVDERMRAAIKPVQYLKVHGCINHRSDNDVPLILSWEQYSSHAENRTRLNSRLRDYAHECPVVFIGYALADAHIRELIYRIDPGKRPRWYIVDPASEDEDVRYWARKNVEVFKCTFSSFMRALDESIPRLMRFLTPPDETIRFPLRTYYHSASIEESDNLRRSLSSDFTLVQATMPIAEQQAKEFYSGYDTGWGAIVRRLDARRKVTDDLLYRALLEHSAPHGPVFFVLRGPAGAGKTIALKRAAFDAATASDALVLWFNETGQLRAETILEVAELSRRTVYVFIDQIAVHVDAFAAFVKTLKARSAAVVLIGAEREADWMTYCSDLEETLPPHFVRIGHLSMTEVENLLDALKRHDCLGELEGKSREEQVDAFMAEEKADRQLLVALHTLTRGLPFEKIVLSEYEDVRPEQARKMYLDIATMNQFSVPVRAGTISRISGVALDEYNEKFFGPLKGMVSIVRDPYSGDFAYKTRHSRVAQILFRQVCNDDASRLSQITHLILGLDVGYSSDRRALESICRGRNLKEAFGDPLCAREIFAAALQIAPKQAFLHQQWAIFETLHEKGDFRLAETHALAAAEMAPWNQTFKHTQAEVARKRANQESSPVLREQLRRSARQKLNEMSKGSRFQTASRCKLVVDEVADLADTLTDGERVSDDSFFAEKLKEAETTLAKAQQEFPDDAEMIEAEARLWDELKNRSRALRALERAWKKSPRGTGTAIRIAKLYKAADRGPERLAILTAALERDPDDKPSHLAVAVLFLEEPDWKQSSIERHLGKSFTSDDRNYEARFLLAEYLFAKGDVLTSAHRFSEIDARSPSEFRRFPPKADDVITVRLPTYTGTIDTKQAGSCFIRSGAYPNSIFAHRSAFDATDFDELEVGSQVTFRLRFNRRGPVGVNVATKM